jgi:hypothetical protein
MELYIWGKDSSTPPEKKKVDFVAKYAYAYPETVNGQRTLWMVVADQSPDSAALDNVDDRNSALLEWCGKQHARYSALKLDSHNKPMASRVCAGDGRADSSRLSEDSTMSSRGKAELTVNDGKRVEGSMVTGAGSKRVGDKESFYEITGDYHLSTDVAAPTLRDRVLAGGDEKASGIPGAKAAFLKYWKAAGNTKTVEEISPWFTPERQAHSARQQAEMAELGNMAKSMLEQYNKEHSGTPSIASARAIGAAAVVTSESTSGDAKLTCQTLLLQLQGTWKVGNENCAWQAKK